MSVKELILPIANSGTMRVRTVYDKTFVSPSMVRQHI